MAYIPRDSKFDSTLSLLSEGYPFISKRCQELGSDAFTTRLMLKKVTCAVGEDAAKMFYHPDRFSRKKAMPPTTLMLLQDLGSVQLREGAAHRHRKQLFMSLMTVDHIDDMVQRLDDKWHAALQRWQQKQQVTLQDEVREVLCRAACQWAGIDLTDEEAAQRTKEFGAMIDGAGTAGPKNWRGIMLRNRTERWAQDLIEQVRQGQLKVPEQAPLAVIAKHRDMNGELLEIKVAAVELLNIIRPTVAVARFITFAALALHEHPECAEPLQNDEQFREWFVQEVRRFYPFFPCIGGRVREAFSWKGQRFDKGEWVLLDLYGTNHDARIWDEPEKFKPDRFRHWNGSAFNFIPQGAGGFHDGHRCPGERLTIELVKKALKLLVSDTSYKVPDQNLTIDLTQMPAIPQDGFIMSEVRAVQRH